MEVRLAIINSFDAPTTRRLAGGLVASGGALLLACFGLIGAGVSGGDKAYASGVSGALLPLVLGLLFGIAALVCVELAEHPLTPESGHPHSRPNYLQTAFVFVVLSAPFQLGWGLITLLIHAAVAAPLTQ
jgi:hypothetical protein